MLQYRLLKLQLPFHCRLHVRLSPLHLCSPAEIAHSLSPRRLPIINQPSLTSSLSLFSFPLPSIFFSSSLTSRLAKNQSVKAPWSCAWQGRAPGRAAIHQENNKIKITLLYLIWSFIFPGGLLCEGGRGSRERKSEKSWNGRRDERAV